MTPILTFFNNKGGVGKTSLIYHLAWTFADMGRRVVAVDLDPQSNLTAAFFPDDEIEKLWENTTLGATIYQCVKPLERMSDIARPVLKKIDEGLYVLPGDVALSKFEDSLSLNWPQSMNSGDVYRPMRILSAFWQIMQMAADDSNADLILVDIGPNLGAINRSVLIATNYIVIPLGADLFSLQGLKNLGPSLHNWKMDWEKRLGNWNSSDEARETPDFHLPIAEMRTIGYVCQQHGVRMDRPVKAYTKWVDRIPDIYRELILTNSDTYAQKTEEDANCLATIKHYRSLIPMGQECRKPIFKLTSADGAIGGHAAAVLDAKKEFIALAEKIARRMGLQ